MIYYVIIAIAFSIMWTFKFYMPIQRELNLKAGIGGLIGQFIGTFILMPVLTFFLIKDHDELFNEYRKRIAKSC